jgi:hypothetical protein
VSAKLVVASAYRYEPTWLVDEWREHVSWADDVLLWDTRNEPAAWVPRAERVEWMMRAAEEVRADFVLILDMDERLSLDAPERLRAVADAWRPGKPFAFKFTLLEFFTPTQYRIDGVWGKKTRRRLFHLESRRRDMLTPCTRLKRPLIAHTKMMEESNAAVRAETFNRWNTWDRAGRGGGEGFDYLADRSGMVLKTIPEGMFPPLRPWKFRVPGVLDGSD